MEKAMCFRTISRSVLVVGSLFVLAAIYSQPADAVVVYHRHPTHVVHRNAAVVPGYHHPVHGHPYHRAVVR